MKREELRAIEGLTEAQIDAIMKLHNQDESAHKVAMQQIQSQLDTATQGLKAFEGVDVNRLKNQVTELTTRLEQQKADFAFEATVRKAAHDAQARNEDDVITLLPNKDSLKASQNQAADVAAAMAALKTSKPYLFGEAKPADPAKDQPAAEGSAQQPGTPPIVVPKPRPQGGVETPTLSDFINMTGAERMALRTKNPALFQQLSNEVRQKRRW